MAAGQNNGSARFNCEKPCIMERNIVILSAKGFVAAMLIVYFLVGILVARQVFLMNKAVKTKLAGLLNCLSIVHIVIILVMIVLVIVV